MNDPLIGRQIAGYRVERILGRGGMASVYVAWDTIHERVVALKVLDERNREIPSSVERFIQEAQTIATWSHPNIVSVYDAGEEDGIYYYAMEFIRGLDLSQLLRQYIEADQLLPYSDVLRIGWSVASALDYAHQRGIVHRDVKPSNVLISVDGRVLLSDFGLVMDVSRGTLGETFGSPHYIAPEQARNSAYALPQSDLYSLGVMLYEMLTGMTPFEDPSPTTLALKHLTEAPPPPRLINPRLSPQVEAVLLRALNKQAQERYSSGRGLMTALEQPLIAESSRLEPDAPLPLPAESAKIRADRRAALLLGKSPPPIPGHLQAQPDTRPAPSGLDATIRSGSGGWPVDPAQQAGSPNIRPASNYPQDVPLSGPQPVPQAYESSRRPAGGPPGMDGAPPYAYNQSGGIPPAGPPPQPRARSGWGSLGCLALLFAVIGLGILIGAALAFNLPARLIPGGIIGQVETQETPTAQPTDTPPPSLTPTLEPTQTPEPSPTATETPLPPTETPTTTATATEPPPTPTDALPTATPVPPTATDEPLARLVIVRGERDRGIVLVNAGNQPIPLEPFEIWDSDEELLGEDWEVETLEPGECVFAWERDREPRIPDDIECEPVGETVYRQGRSRFWTRTMHIRWEGEEIYSCRTREETCEIDLDLIE